MRKLRFDVRWELFAGGAVSHMVGSETTFVLARVKLAGDESLAILHVPHQSTRVSLLREGFGSLAAGDVDTDLDRSDTDLVLGEGDKTSVSTNGKVRVLPSLATMTKHWCSLSISLGTASSPKVDQPSIRNFPSPGNLKVVGPPPMG